jgi:hypothetical protein
VQTLSQRVRSRERTGRVGIPLIHVETCVRVRLGRMEACAAKRLRSLGLLKHVAREYFLARGRLRTSVHQVKMLEKQKLFLTIFLVSMKLFLKGKLILNRK